MEAGADDVCELYEASRNGCVCTLNGLIQKDPFILHKIPLNPLNETPLHISALLGHLEFTKALLRENSSLVSEFDSFRRSPLHLASVNGHAEIIKALLEVNKDVCLVADQDGRIPIHLAAMRGRVDVLQELFDAKPESIKVPFHGETVFHLCVRYNHLQALKLLVSLVDDGDQLLQSRNLDGNTILHLAATLKQFENVCYLLSVPKTRASANEIQDVLAKVGVRRGNEPPPPPQSILSRFGESMNEYLTRRGKWIEKMQDTLMLVATVMATVTFQAVITSPPGGFMSMGDIDDVCKESDVEGLYGSVKYCKAYLAGTSQSGYYDSYANHGFIAFNTISFISSVAVIFLTISGFHLKSRYIMLFFTFAMITAVWCLLIAYLFGLSLVLPNIYDAGSFYHVFYFYCIIPCLCLFSIVCFFWSLDDLILIVRKLHGLINSHRPLRTTPAVDRISV